MTLTPRDLLAGVAALRSGPTHPNPEYDRALFELAAHLLGGDVDQVRDAADAVSTARFVAHPDAGQRLPLTSPVGTFHDPSGGLTPHALELGRILTQLEEDGRAEGPEWARTDEFLRAEPSYRWNFRNPCQAKLGAGWEDELIGRRYLFNGEPHTVIAIESTPDDWWLVHVADGRIFAAPRFTVLDEPPLVGAR